MQLSKWAASISLVAIVLATDNIASFLFLQATTLSHQGTKLLQKTMVYWEQAKWSWTQVSVANHRKGRLVDESESVARLPRNTSIKCMKTDIKG